MKVAITKREMEIIGGLYVSLWFYNETRDEIPTGKDLIRYNMDGITDEEMEKFQEAADALAGGLLEKADETTERLLMLAPEHVPSEEGRLKMIKQLACAFGYQACYDAKSIKVSEKVYQIMSGTMVNLLWEDTHPTEEVLSAIWLEGMGLALMSMNAWEMAADTPLGEHVISLMKQKFLIMDPPTKPLKYDLQYPS